MESNKKDHDDEVNEEEEEKNLMAQIEEIKDEIKRTGVSDPTEYIERELAGLKLDAEQREMLK